MEGVLKHKRESCDGKQFGPSRLKRGDLGQLAPRKKLLKSFRAFLEDFLRSLQAFGTEGFFVFGPLPADPKSIQVTRVDSCGMVVHRSSGNFGDRGYGRLF